MSRVRRTSLAALIAVAGLLTFAPGPASAARVKVTATASATSVVAGTPVTVRGTARRRVKVALQRRVAHTWTTVSTARTSATGRYALPFPTSWYLAHRLRVWDAKDKVASKPLTIRVRPSYAPRGSARSYRVMFRERWNPCHTITWAINPQGGIKNQVAVFSKAINDVSLATGFRFKFAGTTTAKAFAARDVRKANIVFDWQTPAENNDLAGSTFGVANHRTASRGRLRQVVGGDIALDVTHILNPDDYMNDPATIEEINDSETQRIAEHELAHTMGLDHVNDPMQTMNPSETESNWQFNAGDLAGLSRVGAINGCQGHDFFKRR